jgi:diguanylate cyclase (GGDEF)-like protein
MGLATGALMQRKIADKTAGKVPVRVRPTKNLSVGDLNAQVVRLSRENATLRRDVAKLQVFRAMAYRDPLTGLWNRRYFEERLNEEQSRSQRAGAGRRFSVLVVDINDFKIINDDHGHPVGDALLKWAGDFLATHLRTHDVPCRTGGDEFAVLLPDVSSEDAARLIARLREQLVVANRTREIPLALSLGTATWPDSGATVADLVAHADEEMYADKRRQKAATEATNAARTRSSAAKTTRRAPKEATTPAPFASDTRAVPVV